VKGNGKHQPGTSIIAAGLEASLDEVLIAVAEVGVAGTPCVQLVPERTLATVGFFVFVHAALEHRLPVCNPRQISL